MEISNNLAPIRAHTRQQATRFGNQPPQAASLQDLMDQLQLHTAPHPGMMDTSITSAERIKGAIKGGTKNIFNPKGIMKDVLISAIIAAATAWLPGSQLLTVPLWMTIGAIFRAIDGAAQGYRFPRAHALPAHTDTPMVIPIVGG